MFLLIPSLSAFKGQRIRISGISCETIENLNLTYWTEGSRRNKETIRYLFKDSAFFKHLAFRCSRGNLKPFITVKRVENYSSSDE